MSKLNKVGEKVCVTKSHIYHNQSKGIKDITEFENGLRVNMMWLKQGMNLLHHS